jgi:hypothetical protein
VIFARALIFRQNAINLIFPKNQEGKLGGQGCFGLVPGSKLLEKTKKAVGGVPRTASRFKKPRQAAQPIPERFPAKWMPVRVKKTRKNKKIEPRSNSIGSE